MLIMNEEKIKLIQYEIIINRIKMPYILQKLIKIFSYVII